MRLGRLAVLAAAGLLCVWAAYRLDLDALARELGRMNPAWLIAAAISNLAALFLWPAMWEVFLPQGSAVPYRRMFRITAVSGLVMNTAPFPAGHALGATLLGRLVGAEASLSVLALDQLAKGLAKLSLIVIAAIMVPLPAWLDRALLVVALGVAVLAAVLILARAGAAAGSRNAEQRGAVARIIAFFQGWAQKMEALGSVRLFVQGLLWALSIKAVEVLAVWAVQQGLGLPLGWGAAVVVTAAINTAGMIPGPPAGLLIFEAAVFLVYCHLGLPAETSVGLALILHGCFLFAAITPGLVVLAYNAVIKGIRFRLDEKSTRP